MPIKYKKLPPHEQLLQLYDYNPFTGELIHQVTRGSAVMGTEAGCINGRRQRTEHKVTYVGRKKYYCHRIIWKWMTGEDPPHQIDHRNGNSLDNRWNNLRLATPGQNLANQKSTPGSSSRYLGVHWCNKHKKWIAQIRKNNKNHRLGSFSNEEKAAKVYDRAARRFHGEFANLNFPGE